jgi:small-conductance mechanosensitive channel
MRSARIARASVLLLSGLLAGAAAAQAPPSPPQDALRTKPAAAEEPATVVVGGRDVAVLRERVLGYSPRERAAAAAFRIRDAIAGGGAAAVSLRDVAEGKLLQVGGRGVLLLTPGDLDPLADEGLDGVGERAKQRLAVVVAEDRERHDAKRLLVAAAVTAGVTFVAWGLFVVLGRVRRRVQQRLDRDVAERIKAVKLGGAEHLTSEPLLVALRFGFRLLFFVLYVALVLAWLDVALTRFPATRPVGEKLTQLLLEALATVGGGLLSGIPGLLVVAAIVILARLVARSLTAFFRRVESGALDVAWLEADIAAPTRRIVIAVLWIFALVMAYPYIPGSKSEAFKGISVLVGLMISLGATGAVGQAASGLMLLYSRTIRAGEWVRIGGHEGLVTNVGMFATRLRTGLGDEVSIPNAVVVGTTTSNYSRLGAGRGTLVETAVTIGYTEPWRQVEALLLLATDRTPALRKDPKPVVIQKALSDFYVEYRLYAYTDEAANWLRVQGALHANIQDAFNEFGVQILSPHYLGDPAHPAVVPKEKWHLAPAPAPGGPSNG